MRVRELLATFGFDFDETGLKKADRSIKGLFGQLSNLRNILVGGAIAVGFNRIIGLASDAQETMSLLQDTFGDSAQTITQWASDLAPNIGRSQFMLRDFAAQLGAVIQPMVGSREAAAEMSTTLSQLAVDLGAAFNATDEEALSAIRSGLVGSTEPLRRFGIVLTEAQLNAFALEKGLGKTTKQMTEAEKTTLRYEFIMAKTVNSQGNAIRTSEDWAGAVKKAEGQLHELGTTLGMIILPPLNTLLVYAGQALVKFNEMVKGTNFLRNALTVLGVIAGIVGLKMLIPWVPAIAMFALAAAALGVIILLYDSLVTTMEGGDSILTRLIDNWDTWLEQITATRPVLGFVLYLLDAMGKAVAALAGIFTGEWGVVQEALDTFVESLKVAAEFWGKLIGKGIDKVLNLVGVEGTPVSDAGNRAQQLRQDLEAGKEPTLFGMTGRQARERLEGLFGGGKGGNANGVNQQNKVDVTINAAPGMNEEKLAGETEKAIQRAFERQYKQAANALIPAGTGG